MKFVLLAITSCLIFSNAGRSDKSGEGAPIVENPISFGWGKPLDWESGTGGYVPVYAKFWFQELPSFKRTVSLNLSFQARYDLQESILIGMFGSAEAFDVEPTETIWQGPIQKGDIFETSVNLRCREIGRYFLKAVLSFQGRHLFDFGVQWFIDSNDSVYHLSSRPMLVVDEEPNRLPLNHLKNELTLKYRYHLQGDPKESEGFHSIISIKPIPRLGDTVEVTYSLVATRDFPNGVQLHLTATENLEVLEIPKNWVGNVKKNDIYEGVVRIVFRTKGESFLRFGGGRSSEIHFEIGESGDLAYAGRKDKHWYHPEQMAETPGGKRHWPYTRSYYFEPRIK